jgi:hypothetical protein
MAMEARADEKASSIVNQVMHFSKLDPEKKTLPHRGVT